MFQKPKGTADILPGEVEKWQYVESIAREILAKYRFFEIRTPIFESFDLFSRGVGETTDVVTKEMYDFYDKGDRRIALKPEGTAPIVRSYIENKLYAPEMVKPYKVYYISPMFRYERPQGGRQRQFHQIGVEVFGSTNPATDVETIALAWNFFKEVGINDIKLVINSLGDPDSRATYRQALIDYLLPFENELSDDSKTRLHKNPLRVLDSKDPKDKEIVKNAPSILEYLSEDSQQRFIEVRVLLEELNIPYEIDANMVRGLDYYQDTIFEIMSNDSVFGSQTTICGGGAYNGLVEELSGGKQSAAGFGFGIGIERLILLMDVQDVELPSFNQLDVFVVGIGEVTNKHTLSIVESIRRAGFSADRDFLDRKPKRQFKEADKLNASLTITVGESEVEAARVNIKNLATGFETSISMDEIHNDFATIYTKMTTAEKAED